MSVFTESVTLEALTCSECGIRFAMPEWYVTTRRNEGGIFNCPNGHRQQFIEPEVVKLRRELEEKSRALTASKCETLRERQEREKAERKLKRVKNGVCPCCNRSFQNLARHMKTKHPEAKGKP